MLLSRSLKLLVLGCAVFIGGCDRESGPQPQPSQAATASGEAPLGVIDRSHKGSELPDMTFEDGKGGKVRLPDLKGKPLLVNLWATWCAPCVAELPTLEQLAADKAAGLKVLTVSQDMGQTDKVAPFLSDRSLKLLEPWLDPKNDLAFHYATGTLPTTIYYDAQGREVWRYVGGHDWTSAEAAKMLAEGR